MSTYAMQADMLNAGIARMVNKLEQWGILDSTLVLFIPDTGGNYEEIGRRQKNTQMPIFMIDVTLDERHMVAGNISTIMLGPESTSQSNGGPWGNVSNTPFRMYKHSVHEGGIRTPLVAHWSRAGEIP